MHTAELLTWIVKRPGSVLLVDGVTVTFGSELKALYGGVPSKTRKEPVPVPQTPWRGPVNWKSLGRIVRLADVVAAVIVKSSLTNAPLPTSMTPSVATWVGVPAATRRRAVTVPEWSLTVSTQFDNVSGRLLGISGDTKLKAPRTTQKRNGRFP